MKRVKALEPAPQNFLIGNSLPRPTFKHAINSDALCALEFVVIEIRIVNHLAHLAEHLVLDPKSFQKRFECAVVTLMRKISLEHVERHNATIRRNFFRKNKLRFGIDELSDHTGGTDAIDIWEREGETSLYAII